MNGFDIEAQLDYARKAHEREVKRVQMAHQARRTLKNLRRERRSGG